MTFHDLFQGFFDVLHDLRSRSCFQNNVKMIIHSMYFLLCCSKKKSCSVIFHDFPWPTLKFYDFPGLENDIVKFHDFPTSFQFLTSSHFHYSTTVHMSIKLEERKLFFKCKAVYTWVRWRAWCFRRTGFSLRYTFFCRCCSGRRGELRRSKVIKIKFHLTQLTYFQVDKWRE